MKLLDILLEKPSINLVVIKSGMDYRVDPDPSHFSEEYNKAWSQDLSKAHVFKEKAARKFLQAREELARERKTVHPKMQIVQVELDQHGRPVVPGEQQKTSFWDRMRGRKAA